MGKAKEHVMTGERPSDADRWLRWLGGGGAAMASVFAVLLAAGFGFGDHWVLCEEDVRCSYTRRLALIALGASACFALLAYALATAKSRLAWSAGAAAFPCTTLGYAAA